MTGGVSDGEKIRNHYGAVPRNHRGIGSSAGLAEFSDHGLSQFPPALDEQVLLFAQRPDATAVLPIDGKTAGISVSGVGSTVEQQALPSLTGMQWDAPG